MLLRHTAVMSLIPWTTFVEACRVGTLSGTAELLGYTQSAVSRQIAALERDIGVALMSRNARGVSLTQAGEALLPHARLVVATAQHGRAAAVTAGETRHVILGSVPSAAASLLPAAMRRMPDPPNWTMLTGLTPELIRRVADGELDLAVVTDAPPGLPKATGVKTAHLTDDPMAVILPADHRLAARHRVSITDLADERWTDDNPGSESLLRHLAARHGLTLRIEQTSSDLMTKTALVAAGHGIAIVPRMLASALRPDVRLVDLADAPRRGIYAVTQNRRPDLDDIVSALASSSAGR